MNLRSDIRPISYIKTNAAEMLRQVNNTHNPIVITQNGEARAVLMDTDSYQEMRDALGIMKMISQSEAEIAQGKVVTHGDLMERIRAGLKNENVTTAK